MSFFKWSDLFVKACIFNHNEFPFLDLFSKSHSSVQNSHNLQLLFSNGQIFNSAGTSPPLSFNAIDQSFSVTRDFGSKFARNAENNLPLTNFESDAKTTSTILK